MAVVDGGITADLNTLLFTATASLTFFGSPLPALALERGENPVLEWVIGIAFIVVAGLFFDRVIKRRVKLATEQV